MIASWLGEGGSPFIVATHALAEGFDSDQIRLVVHVRGFMSLVQFAQESGRAGRDMQLGHSVVLLREGAVTTNSPGADLFSSDSSALDGYRSSAEEGATVKRFLDGGMCLRRALSLYIDAKEYVRSCEGEDELCSVCAHPPPSTSLPPTATPARTTTRPPVTPRSISNGASAKPPHPSTTPASSSTTATSFSLGQPTPSNVGKRPPPTPEPTPDTGYRGGTKRRHENVAHRHAAIE